MRDELQSVLDLQPQWIATGSDEEVEDMQLRGLYVRGDIPSFVNEYRDEIAARLLIESEEVEVEGKNSTGYYSRVPWVRIANRLLSPNPRTGWYVVYLFAEDGTEASLSLNQGTQEWDGVGSSVTPGNANSRPKRLGTRRARRRRCPTATA